MRGMNLPSRFFELPTDTVHVLCLDLAEQWAVLAAGLDVLDSSEQARAARYADPWNGQRYACARALLRHVLGRFLNQAPADIELRYGAYGKPALNGSGGPDFNLSHCGDWVALAVSRERRIGIDLENRVENQDCLAVAAQCFSPREWAELAQGADVSQAFCAIWVRKEAMVKAAGRGLDAMQTFCTCDPAVSLPDEQGLPTQWHVDSLPAPAGHHLALAVEGGPARNRCFQLGYVGSV